MGERGNVEAICAHGYSIRMGLGKSGRRDWQEEGEGGMEEIEHRPFINTDYGVKYEVSNAEESITITQHSNKLPPPNFPIPYAPMPALDGGPGSS